MKYVICRSKQLIKTSQVIHDFSPPVIMNSYFVKKQRFQCLNYAFVSYKRTQLFTSQDVSWWTGVLWISGVLLWCFYQLFGLSFWRHPFTAVDPLVSKWCNAKFLQNCSDEETNSFIFWMAWEWIHFQQIFIFGYNMPLN